MIDVAPARRLERPGWLNARTVAGVLLFALAFASGQRLLAEARTTVPAWTAARDLATGTVIGADDLRPADVKLPAEVVSRYATTTDDLVGVRLARPVAAGELVPAAALAGDGPDDATAVTVPVTADHAAGGTLRAGDRVVVYATFDARGPDARTVPVVQGAEVVGVVAAGGLVGDDETIAAVTLGVTQRDAARLAFAARNADLDVVLQTGVPGARDSATVTAQDFP